MSPGSAKNFLMRELALFLGLLLVGLVLLPIAIYWLGPRLLGEFGGHGFSDFFGSLVARLRAGEFAAWFLVYSPYLVIQVLRLTRLGWRASRPTSA